MSSPFCLADFERIRQVSLLRESRQPFDTSRLWDDDGLLFLSCSFDQNITFSTEMGLASIAVHGSPSQSELASSRREELSDLSEQHRAELLNAGVGETTFGLLWERLFWVIHEAAVNARQANITIPLPHVRAMLWGKSRTQHWRTTLRKLCTSLCRVQIWDQTESVTEAQMFLDVSIDAVGNPSECGNSCPWRNQGGHEHLRASLGLAALGVIERIFQSNHDGGRSFPAESSEAGVSLEDRWRKQLSEIGKTGQLTQIYLPAVLGNRTQVRKLKPSGHRLLQVIVREATRPGPSSQQSHWSGLALREFRGNKVPNHQKMTGGSSTPTLECPFLERNSTYVGFNGNGQRPGQGYKLNTWTKKAGYSNSVDFLVELHRVANLLQLIVAAFHPTHNRWKSVVELKAIAKSHPHVAQQYYLRVYAPTDFRRQWDQFFDWDSEVVAVSPEDIVVEIRALMGGHGLNQSQTAKLLEMNRSHFSKLLSGKRKPKPELLMRLQEALKVVEPEETVVPVSHAPPSKTDFVESHVCGGARFNEAVLSASDAESNLDVAQKYLSCGWSIVPQVSGKKKPAVKWASYQKELPTTEDVDSWWRQFTEAGIALIAGPVSGVLVIDVDGVEAHNELIERLGEAPDAPRVNSGSEDPYRYHLYFQHPNFSTKAKATPWHRNLEFRGNKGLVILPPSIHKSGNPYQWTKRSREWTTPLPVLPTAVSEALRDKQNRRGTKGHRNQQQRISNNCGASIVLPADFNCSETTRRFLQGEFSEGPQWNDKLFRAACDLHARGVGLEIATEMLERGASPWNLENHQIMTETISSAFSERRNPSST